MDLDQYQSFASLDPQGFLAHIDYLPDQLQAAWQLGQTQPLPVWSGITRVMVAGMGGSAIGADLLATYAGPHCRVPVTVNRDYDLPQWASGEQTLVVTCSHSGNTEETLAAFEAAQQSGCRLLAITTGGKLAEAAREAGAVLWPYVYNSQPRAAVGYSFGLLAAAFARLGLIADPADELAQAVSAMHRQQADLKAEVPVVKNPAKRMAGQLIGRWVTVVGAGVLAPVARRWKCQINEVAKSWAQFEYLPEADHNTLAGVLFPQAELARSMVLFLRAPSYHPRNLLRTDLTQKLLMLEGLNTDIVEAQGDVPLAHLWTSLHFGDYTAYYLAMANQVDPTPVEAIEGLKREMRAGC
jgi:glucose/mannose-6-phosphate isomerase